MRRKFAVLASAGLLAVLAAGFTLTPEVRKPTIALASGTFLIPANDGYGFGECLASSGECGRIVADSWCETQGFAKSIAYHAVDPEEVTGSIAATTSSRPISVTCTR